MSTATADPRIVVAQWNRLDAIRERLTAAVAAQYAANQLDDLETTARTVLAGQRAIVAATDAGMAAMAANATGTPARPLGLDPEPLIGAAGRNGRSLESVYARTAVVNRDAGFERGLTYLRQQINLDTQLAQRAAAGAIVQVDTRVTAWRRQTNPAPGGKTCGLCIVAATKTYSKQTLMPIHPMCRCTVTPIYSTDPIAVGDIFDRDRLDAVYAAAGPTRDRKTLGKLRFDAADLPAGVDSEVIAALGPRVQWHPEWGEFLTGNRHDSAALI